MPDSKGIPLWLGVSLGLLASLVQSFGLALQRKSHILTAAQPLVSQRPSHKRPLWLLGFTIFISSNVLGTIFQVGALPIVVLAPLGAVSLLYNSLFAKFLLGDVFTRWMGFGTVLITTGAVLIATFGVVEEPLLELAELLRLFARGEWWLFSSLVGGGVAIALAICHTVEYLLERRSPAHGPIHLPTEEEQSPPTPLTKLPTSAQAAASAETSTTRTSERVERTRLYLALAYAFISGTLSGLCLIFAKTGVELLLSTLSSRKSQFSVGTVVFGGGGLIVLALAQLAYLNHALRLQSPTIVCPTAFASYNCSSVFGGLVYFDQLSQLTGLKLGLVGLGVAILLLGVGAVSMGGCSGSNKGCEGGGVGVGVWVEEEEDEAEEEEEEPGSEESYFDEPYADDPTSFTASAVRSPLSPPLSGGRSRPSLPNIHTSPQGHQPPRRSSTIHSHARYLPFSPTLPPPSPTASHRAGHGQTLSVEQQPQHPTSTGLFSIGLGAASPGFFVVGRPAGGHSRRGSLDAGGLGRRRSEPAPKSGLGLPSNAGDEENEARASTSALAD